MYPNALDNISNRAFDRAFDRAFGRAFGRAFDRVFNRVPFKRVRLVENHQSTLLKLLWSFGKFTQNYWGSRATTICAPRNARSCDITASIRQSANLSISSFRCRVCNNYSRLSLYYFNLIVRPVTVARWTFSHLFDVFAVGHCTLSGSSIQPFRLSNCNRVLSDLYYRWFRTGVRAISTVVYTVVYTVYTPWGKRCGVIVSTVRYITSTSSTFCPLI